MSAYLEILFTWRTVIIETKAEFGIEALPIAARVAVITITTTFPAVIVKPFAYTNKW